MPSQHLFFQSAPCPLYSSASPLSFSSSSSYQSSLSDPSFEPNNDIYYAAEQDGVYSYQPLFSVPNPWPPEQLKEKHNTHIYQDNYYINGNNTIPLDPHHQFNNFSHSYSIAVAQVQPQPHSQFPYNDNNPINNHVHSTLHHPQNTQPSPTYPNPVINYHYDDVVTQDHYIHPAELSPSDDNVQHQHQHQPCIPQDLPDSNPDIDADADADAEGEDDFFDPEYQDDGEPDRYSPSQTSSFSRSRRASAETPPSAHTMESTLFATASSGLQTRRRTRPVTPLPVPIPVPNLTKKSRGRRVPTVASLAFGGRPRAAHSFNEDDYTDTGRRRSGTRMYTCKVAGCGKCFARGEHLKRHVRSIHTYEKPHKCPYPGCGKDFSRHDNLGQHMRVHKDYVGSTTDSRAFRS